MTGVTLHGHVRYEEVRGSTRTLETLHGVVSGWGYKSVGTSGKLTADQIVFFNCPDLYHTSPDSVEGQTNQGPE